MTDEQDRVESENAAEIKRKEAVTGGPRGNVTSEDDPLPEHDAPPPMPN